MVDNNSGETDMTMSCFGSGPSASGRDQGIPHVTRTGLAVGLACSWILGFSLPGIAESGNAIKEGKEGFVTYCASCHGEKGEGNGPVAGSLKKRPPDLTYLQQQENDGQFPYKRVMDIVQGNPEYDKNFRTHGPAAMPVWGKIIYEDSNERTTIAETRIRHIVDYIKSIQK